MFAAAFIVAVGGVLMSRREVTSREVTGRSNLQEFAASLQKELARLDALYEHHLRDLALAAGESGDAVRTQQICRGLRGVTLCSFLFANNSDNPTHIRIEGDINELPKATLKPLLGSHMVVLPKDRILASDTNSPDSGWEVIPESVYSIYWQRLSRYLVVALTVDTQLVAEITRQHIALWTKKHFAPVMAHHGLDQLIAPDNSIAAQSESITETRHPDFVSPLSSRWGLWQLMSWDRMATKTVYHIPTLYGAGILSGTLILLGIIFYRSQCRAQLLTEQRVSFVNHVSHELGTPLTNMLLNFNLTRELMDSDSENAKHRLSLAEEETRRLSRLTANVLTFSRSERGQLKLHPLPCSPTDVLVQIIDHFLPALQRRGITVETIYQAQETVLLDADALAQIVANLISNVEKYAAGGGWMGLESEWSDGWLTIKVADRGPGIPAKHWERIFQPFERLADHLDEGASGTGLGLSISRNLAKQMGGTLTVDQLDDKNILVLRIPAPSAVEKTSILTVTQPKPMPA